MLDPQAAPRIRLAGLFLGEYTVNWQREEDTRNDLPPQSHRALFAARRGQHSRKRPLRLRAAEVSIRVL